MEKKKRKSTWKWYSVLLLFESTISEKPDLNKIDKNFKNDIKLYEERIIIIKAQSYNHAYKLADNYAKEYESEYINPYEQKVNEKFIDSLHCQELIENEIKSGIEIYYRMYEESAETDVEQVIENRMPEVSGNKTPFYNFLIDRC